MSNSKITVEQKALLDYQGKLLHEVSRSFALATPQLPVDLQLAVGNVYLLCRVADTIEDAPNLETEQKEIFLERWAGVVADREDVQAFAEDFGAVLDESTSQHERNLVADTPRLVNITHNLNSAQRASIERCTEIMTTGMAEFQFEVSPEGLNNLIRFDRYCYHVAGVFGETLTDLFCDYSSEIDEVRDDLFVLSSSYGQGLQMTNILKDIWEDKARGVCWLPNDVFEAFGVALRTLVPGQADPGFIGGLNQLISLAVGHLRNAFDYITLIPKNEAGIRRYCLWSLGMAILTLRRIYATPTYTTGGEVKISRNAVKTVIVAVEALARSNPMLKLFFRSVDLGLPVSRIPTNVRNPKLGLRTAEPSAPTANDFVFQKEILQRVSVTYAKTLPQLPEPLRTVVENSYLLCRITDTIEDDPKLERELKEHYFQRLISVMNRHEDSTPFAKELSATLSTVTVESNRDLIRESEKIFRILHSFSEPQQQAITRCITTMANGMVEFSPKVGPNGLKDVAELDRYCYYVAGCVAEMLVDLLCDHSPAANENYKELYSLSVEYGHGLQMTNILQELWDDRRAEVCWLPRTVFKAHGFDLDELTSGHESHGFSLGLDQLVGLTRHHLAGGLSFILSIPTQETGIRKHLLWTLGLSVLALRKIYLSRGYRRGENIKVSRNSVAALLLTLNVLVRSNLALKLFFGALTARLPNQR